MHLDDAKIDKNDIQATVEDNIKFLTLKNKVGRSFNSKERNMKEYRNLDFLLHAVTYQDIDQIRS
ncbi:hypothetical protein CTI12_AA033310 [Artemisia annua]|uniref:Uncharacterized protein n=1 Tax=Artemisia annua TaxID=35608 RepID=A0A2U1QEY1_ARTAN|nr:hypothetical protein CTI12_AA033310 [Artemisia annua]